MKKLFCAEKTLLYAVIFVFSVITAAFALMLTPAKADGATADYRFVASTADGVPTNDFVHSTTAGNQEQTYSSYDNVNKELVLINAPGGGADCDKPGGTVYLGGIFLVNPGVTDYTDFTFTMKFRITQWVNDARWVGIMYRMQTDESTGLHSGYIFTSRVNGASAYTSNAGVRSKVSGGTSNNGFNDQDVKAANYSHPYTDGKYHTITVTMSGNTATHYIDGVKVRDANTSVQDANIDPRDRGGFAIIASQVTINIAELTIARGVTAPDAFTPASPSLGYSVKDFSTVSASDWAVNHKSDVAGSTVRVDDNKELVINAANAAAGVYYGALLPINPGTVYKNFTFELTFKVNRSNGDAHRWLGIVYRTKFAKEDTPVSGYVMNYRINGRNAYSAINQNKAFKDIGEIAIGGSLADGTSAPPLLDGEYHRLTVTMQGDSVANHYIDGHLVREASTEDQRVHMGSVYTEGGFALIVNSMEINVKNCTITPDEVIIPEQTEQDTALVTTYQDPAVKIINAPTVVSDVSDAATLSAISGAEKPSNAILRFNKDENIVGSDGTVLGKFSDIYTALDHKVIPVVQVDDEDAADALITYLSEKQKILDIAVMSDKPALVKKVRSACPKTRGVIEYTAADFYTDEKLDIFDNIVARSNANYAMTVVIPQSVATLDNVRYIQARFKTVWVRPDSNKPVDLFACINSGAYGIVGDFGKIYDALETYPRSYTRMPFNVAHRGKHTNNAQGPYENSLNAVQAAIDFGATHLELDGHMTSDGHIVIMHDDTINRTTNYTGNKRIPEMTLAEIRNYTLNDGQKIPVLEDVFDLLYKSKQQGKDIVFVFELKAGSRIVEKIDSLLGTGEGQYDVRDNLVIISFDSALLLNVKSIMPGTPTSYLQGNSVGANSLASDLLSVGFYNCGLDTCYSGNTTPQYDKTCLTDRGIAGWYWTFGNDSDTLLATQNGHIGLTNNAPGALTSRIMKIEGAPDQSYKTLKTGDYIFVNKRLYSGVEQRDGTAKVTFCEETESGWTVVASLNKNSMTLYTQPFAVSKSAPVDPPQPTNKHTVKIYNGNSLIYDEEIDHNGAVSFTPPTLDGYTFDGYFTDAAFGTPATLPTAVTADITLYAKYTPVTPVGPNDPDKPTPEDPNDPNKPDDKHTDGNNDGKTLDAGAITGIVLGSVAGVGLIAGTTVIIKKRKGKKPNQSKDESENQ